MIALVASGADSNPAGASAFVGIPQPIGIANGDLILVAVALPAAGVTVTPPSSDWTQLVATDPALALAMSVWWTTALNLPPNLVFALSASCRATGTCLAYRGVDPFTPIEASVATLTSMSNLHAVGSVTAQQASEEAALFIAGDSSGTYLPAGGFIEAARSQQAGCSIEAQHRQLQNAGTLAAFTELFSGPNGAGVSVVIILAPSAGTLTYDDTYARTFGALPKGIDNLLDFTPGAGDFYKYFWVIGSMLKLGFDLVDLVTQEIVPFLARYKLPEWERLFGLTQTRAAQLGTIPQRQAQVLGAWRAAAAQSASFQTVAATLGPLLGYFPTTPVQIIEADPSTLRLYHSYDLCGGFDKALPVGTTVLSAYVNDGGKVSKMGAQLTLTFASADTSLYSFTLTAPDGTTKTWAAGSTNAPLWLTAPELSGAQIQGMWTLAITNGSFLSNTLHSSLQLFVEGIGPRQQTGGAIFEWGVYADPAHLGENGTPPDFSAARAAIKKMSLSHSVGNLLQGLAPYPNTDSGIHAAVPDECIPT